MSSLNKPNPIQTYILTYLIQNYFLCLGRHDFNKQRSYIGRQASCLYLADISVFDTGKQVVCIFCHSMASFSTQMEIQKFSACHICNSEDIVNVIQAWHFHHTFPFIIKHNVDLYRWQCIRELVQAKDYVINIKLPNNPGNDNRMLFIGLFVIALLIFSYLSSYHVHFREPQ